LQTLSIDKAMSCGKAMSFCSWWSWA